MPIPDDTKVLDLGEYFETVLIVKKDGKMTFINGHPNVLIIMHDYDDKTPAATELDIMRGNRYAIKYAGRPEALEKLSVLMENLQNENTSIVGKIGRDNARDTEKSSLENDQVSDVHDS